MERIFMKHRNDCYTCCLAMILGLQYEEVPRFIDDADNGIGEGFNKEVDKFLASRGMQCISMNAPEGWMKENIKGYCIVVTQSALKEYRDKGFVHSVIYKDGEFWHDPKQYSEIRMDPLYIDLIVPIIGD